jgi:hypothetical protein
VATPFNIGHKDVIRLLSRALLKKENANLAMSPPLAAGFEKMFWHSHNPNDGHLTQDISDEVFIGWVA